MVVAQRKGWREMGSPERIERVGSAREAPEKFRRERGLGKGRGGGELRKWHGTGSIDDLRIAKGKRKYNGLRRTQALQLLWRELRLESCSWPASEGGPYENWDNLWIVLRRFGKAGASSRTPQ